MFMSEAEEYFQKLAKEIPEGKAGKMFGAACIKAHNNGKSAAMFWKDCMVVKLSGDKFNEALSLDGSKLFEPMEGRAMKEWVQIPFHYKKEWKKYALASMEIVKKIKK
jgi:hypothetical protein